MRFHDVRISEGGNVMSLEYYSTTSGHENPVLFDRNDPRSAQAIARQKRKRNFPRIQLCLRKAPGVRNQRSHFLREGQQYIEDNNRYGRS